MKKKPQNCCIWKCFEYWRCNSLFPPEGRLVLSSEAIWTNHKPTAPLLSRPCSVDTSCMFLCDVFHSLGAAKPPPCFSCYIQQRELITGLTERFGWGRKHFTNRSVCITVLFKLFLKFYQMFLKRNLGGIFRGEKSILLPFHYDM